MLPEEDRVSILLKYSALKEDMVRKNERIYAIWRILLPLPNPWRRTLERTTNWGMAPRWSRYH